MSALITRACTDLCNSERFTDQHGEDVRFCSDLGRHVYDGKKWKRDKTGEWTRRAAQTVRRIYDEAARSDDPDRRKALSEWAKRSESASRIAAMTMLAESAEGVAITTDELDRDPMKINTLSGTVDLTTGKQRPHDRLDLMTKIAGTHYDERATCPVFEAFLESVLEKRVDLIAFLQRFMGYALTGDVREQVLLFCFGTGANGKSTFIDLMVRLLGGYAMPGAPGLLVAKKHEDHPTALADLRGARLVTCVEIGEGRRFDEERLKALTGGDLIKARHMREDFFTFAPSHKLMLAANHRPIVRGTDPAIWRRILLVPFTVAFTGEQRDPAMPEKLRAELPGILRWAVEGCLAWQRDGLRPPSIVTDATKAYRAEQDVLGHWIADACTTTPAASGQASKLYSAYREWCRRAGENEVTQTAFGLALAERGFEKDKTRTGWIWRGIDAVTGCDGPSSSPANSPSRETNRTTLHNPSRGDREDHLLSDEAWQQ